MNNEPKLSFKIRVLIGIIALGKLGKLGISVTSFVAAIGALSLGAGLAMQGLLANYAAGLNIIIARPFIVGDTIELGLKSATDLCSCSRTDVKPILSKLEKFGFLTCIQKGKQGSQTFRSSIYRREA